MRGSGSEIVPCGGERAMCKRVSAHALPLALQTPLIPPPNQKYFSFGIGATCIITSTRQDLNRGFLPYFEAIKKDLI